jgi:hypothetical protein
LALIQNIQSLCANEAIDAFCECTNYPSLLFEHITVRS